jgi:hypothetical protein
MEFQNNVLDNINFDEFEMDLLLEEELGDVEPYPEPTKLRISTMTATCKSGVFN